MKSKGTIENNEKIKNYYGEDLHNNQKSFEYIIKEFFRVYKAI